MRGRNILELNKATVNEALQEYLEKRFKMLKFKIEDVKAKDETTFLVAMSEIMPSDDEEDPTR